MGRTFSASLWGGIEDVVVKYMFLESLTHHWLKIILVGCRLKRIKR
jgi:hypothetical protein